MPTTISDLLDERAASAPRGLGFEQVAGARHERVDWAEFKRRVDALSLALADLGLAAGDSVAVMGQTTGEWATADLGVLGAGGVSVGIYSTLTPDQIAYLLNDCQARFAVVGSKAELETLRAAAAKLPKGPVIVGWGDAEGAEGVHRFSELLSRGAELLRGGETGLRALRARRGPEDVALLIYTSGTTGVPKGAMLSHRNILWLLGQLALLLPANIGGDDVTVAFLPMAHVGEHVISFYGRIKAGYGARYVGSLESQEVLAALTETRPTLFGSVPRIFEKAYAKVRARVAEANPRRRAIFAWAEAQGRAMSRHRLQGTSPPLSLRLAHRIADRLVLSKIRAAFGGRVRFFVSGAAPIDPEILEFFHGCGMLVLEAYGMTECGGIATVNRPEHPRFGTVGQAVPGVEVRTAPDGEILVRGPSVFRGYLNKPAETAEALDPEGWLHTGDIGELDAEGYLRITDRKKNLIVTAGGKKVAPAPIEALLTGEPLLGPALSVGEQRPYMTALLTLDLEEARAATGLPAAGAAELARHPEVRRRAAAAVEKANAQLARYEQIRRFRLLSHELAVGSDELTPTMKLRRKAVAERFRDEIESLYAPALEEGVLEPRGAGGAAR
ncbi:MAG: AMP-dependent synthetase/ligase [Myxococcales bacterium]